MSYNRNNNSAYITYLLTAEVFTQCFYVKNISLLVQILFSVTSCNFVMFSYRYSPSLHFCLYWDQNKIYIELLLKLYSTFINCELDNCAFILMNFQFILQSCRYIMVVSII